MKEAYIVFHMPQVRWSWIRISLLLGILAWCAPTTMGAAKIRVLEEVTRIVDIHILPVFVCDTAGSAEFDDLLASRPLGDEDLGSRVTSDSREGTGTCATDSCHF